MILQESLARFEIRESRAFASFFIGSINDEILNKDELTMELIRFFGNLLSADFTSAVFAG